VTSAQTTAPAAVKPTPADMPKRITRAATLRWVPIAEMRVSPLAQRELRQARVDRIVASFDLEQIGTPTVSHRGEHYYVIDGQHRIEALRQLSWGDQSLQCWTYTGLSEEDEAERFLKLNDTLAVDAYSKFKVSVQAGRGDESDIDRIVRAARLRVTLDKQPGAIRAVGTLKRIYSRSGPATLAQTLRICRDAYGDHGMEAAVLDGIGLLCQRYEGQLDEIRTMEKLAGAHGGVNGLLGKAENMRRQTGNPRGQCVAAAAVEIYNSGKGGRKLPSWWKSGDSA
jgi:hypothetical protein